MEDDIIPLNNLRTKILFSVDTARSDVEQSDIESNENEVKADILRPATEEAENNVTNETTFSRPALLEKLNGSTYFVVFSNKDGLGITCSIQTDFAIMVLVIGFIFILITNPTKILNVVFSLGS